MLGALDAAGASATSFPGDRPDRRGAAGAAPRVQGVPGRMTPTALAARTRAVIFDAFGTLVTMEDPAAALREELERRGIDVTHERAAAAFRAEIAYYLEHSLEGRDAESLDRLRDRCAEVLRASLADPRLDHASARAAMLAAIRFTAFPDAPAALRTLRERGLRLAIASNWDVSLGDALARTGLAGLADAVVSSAEVGAAKPDRRLFEAALARLGCAADEALYVGDSPANDVAGATAAGIAAVLVRRAGPRIDAVGDGGAAGATPIAVIERLTELPALL